MDNAQEMQIREERLRDLRALYRNPEVDTIWAGGVKSTVSALIEDLEKYTPRGEKYVKADARRRSDFVLEHGALWDGSNPTIEELKAIAEAEEGQRSANVWAERARKDFKNAVFNPPVPDRDHMDYMIAYKEAERRQKIRIEKMKRPR